MAEYSGHLYEYIVGVRYHSTSVYRTTQGTIQFHLGVDIKSSDY
jgi:hypothetical protein